MMTSVGRMLPLRQLSQRQLPKRPLLLRELFLVKYSPQFQHASSHCVFSTSVSANVQPRLHNDTGRTDYRLKPGHSPKCLLCCYTDLNYQPIRFAGHSHWHNIRHTKGLMDARKQKESTRISQKIRLALRGGGSADPALNRDLQRAIDDGRARNVPMASMLEAVKKTKEGKEEGNEFIVEARGFANCLLILECFTDNQNRTRKFLNIILKKYGGSVLDPGVAAHMFDHKGVLSVEPTAAGPKSGVPLDVDSATELAILAGAEEVQEQINDDEQKILQFICDPKELHAVKKSLEHEKVQVREARLQYLPHTFVKLKEAQLVYAAELLEKLEAEPDVLRVYDNIQEEDAS